MTRSFGSDVRRVLFQICDLVRVVPELNSDDEERGLTHPPMTLAVTKIRTWETSAGPVIEYVGADHSGREFFFRNRSRFSDGSSPRLATKDERAEFDVACVPYWDELSWVVHEAAMKRKHDEVSQ